MGMAIVGLSTKWQLYSSMVMSTAIYASETWTSTSKILKKLDVFHQRNLRKIVRVTWKGKVTNAEVLKQTGQKRLQDIVGERRFRFAGHILQMASECPAHCAVDWRPADGRRKGWTKKTWRTTFREDLQARGVNWSETEAIVADHVHWRNLLPIVPQGTAGSKC